MSVKDIDLGWSKILADMQNLDSKSVKVGIQSGATAEDGSNLAMIAAVHEYGNDKTPQRSFIRTALDSNGKQIQSLADQAAGKIIDGAMSSRQALDIIGLSVTGMIQKNIAEGSFTALADSTIKQKGSNKPLIDTGRMRQSIRHVVE